MLIRPLQTEKAFRLESERCYMFTVPANASKQAVAAQVAAQYNVTVIGVRVMTRKGKAIRFNRGKHAYPGTTFRANQKLAFVTLKSGDKIKVFDEAETTKATTAETSSAKKAKAAKEGAK